MRTFATLTLALLAFGALALVPAATSHGLDVPGVPAAQVPTGSLPATAHAPAAPATSAGVPLDTLFAKEVGVALSSPVRGDGPGWASAPTTEYDLRFVCPDVTENVGLPATGQQPPTACPAYVLDVEDILAQPDLAVDAQDNSLVAFHALHGGPGLRTTLQDASPTEASRDNAIHQPHTTFQSKDGGAFWDDNRYYAPTALSSNSFEVFGEDNALELDPDGKVTLASLYSHRLEQGQEPAYVVYLWSSDDISHTMEYEKGNVARDVPAGLVADSLDLAWHSAAEEMVVLWRTSGPDGPRVHVEHKGDEGQWTAWDQQAVVGPCDALSNAAAIGDQVVFACAQGSDTRLWGINDDWTVSDLGLAPLHGLTSLRLASAESMREGGLVLAGATAREGRSVVVVVWGVAGQDWGRPTEVGSSVTDLAAHAGASLVESHLTALAVKGSSGTAHFLLQERFTGGSATDSRVFGKTYGVVHGTGRFLGTFGIGYGDPQSRAAVPATVSGTGLGAYYDRHDGMAVVESDVGGERLFIAFGDYGYVRFAEVVEVEPTVPLFPPIAAPAAIPTLTAATSPAMVAAAAGVLSMAAVSRIVLARSKTAVEVGA